MRSLKSRLLGFGVAASLGTIVVVGCSASGAEGDLTNLDPTDPTEDASKPIVTDTDDDEPDAKAKPKDAGKDASKNSSKDGSADAGPPPPEPGDACTEPNKIFSRSCGTCGTQQALCGADNIVSAYGTCKGEVNGGCSPGATDEVACGNCGTQKRTCNKYCEWTLAGCAGQPANSCSPGTVEFTDASCTTANTYKTKVCQSSCSWGNFTASCAAPPTSILVPPNGGATNTTLVLLNAAQTLTRIPSGACPLTGTFGSAAPYTYIELKNPNPKATSVSIYTSKDPSASASISTYLTSYDGATPPASTETARRQCKATSVSYVSSTYPYDVTIPPSSSVSLLVQATSSSSVTGTGTLVLNVKTESVAP